MMRHARSMVSQEGRTPLHYSSVSRDSAALSALLEGAGASRGARDAAGHTPAHYRGQARELLALPDVMARDNKNAPGKWTLAFIFLRFRIDVERDLVGFTRLIFIANSFNNFVIFF